MHLAFLGNADNYHIQKWLPAMRNQGLDISLITLAESSKEIPGIKTHRISQRARPIMGKHSQMDFTLANSQLENLLKELKPDLLLASYATSYGLLAVRNGFRPLVIQTWTFDLTKYPRQGWKGLYYGSKVARAFDRADLILTDGEALAAQGRELYPKVKDKFEAITWGINLANFQDKLDGDEIRGRLGIPVDAPVLTNGRGVHEWYRPEVTLPAIQSCLQKNEDLWVVVLTLKQDRSDSVQQDLDLLSSHPRCLVFDRMLPRDELKEILEVTDLILSIPPSDGVSELLLEAMYMECIPIVSKIPSNHAFLEDGESGIFIEGDEDNVEDVVATIISTLENMEVTTKKILTRNRNWIEQEASVESSARRVCELLSQVHLSYHENA